VAKLKGIGGYSNNVIKRIGRIVFKGFSFGKTWGCGKRKKKERKKKKKGSKGSTMDWSSSHTEASLTLVSTPHSIGN
jgi:hypothetical protein